MLGNRLIEKLFQKMEDRYGSLWVSRYGSLPRERVKRTWAEDLADMTHNELALGMNRCRDLKWPPTLPEFRELCRPAVDHEGAYWHAVTQMSNRERGTAEAWDSPVIYWAAVRIWPELKTLPYPAVKRRWQLTLDAVLAEMQAGSLPAEIPPRRAELPAPGRATLSRAEALARLATLRSQCAG